MILFSDNVKVGFFVFGSKVLFIKIRIMFFFTLFLHINYTSFR